MDMQTATDVARSDPQYLKNAQEKLQTLLMRSATDTGFRQKLLSDPRSAVSEFTGKPVPENFNIQFVENTADATFVLPDPVSSELSDAELEAVAGGLVPLVVVGLWFAGGAVVGAVTYVVADVLS